MTKYYHRPEKLVRSYKRDEKWFLIEVRDELNELRAFGSCYVSDEFPVVCFNNIDLQEGLYFSELQRWLYASQDYCRKHYDMLEDFDSTLFHWDEFDSLEIQ